jgi:rubrerythrin
MAWLDNAWVCDKCYSDMTTQKIEQNKNLIKCPVCGASFFANDDFEILDEQDEKSAL